MKAHKIAMTAAVILALAVAAYASPIFGTWRGELNGRAITISVTNSNHQASVAMTSAGQEVTVANPSFPKGGPPLDLTFRAGDAVYELHTQDGKEGRLKVTEQARTTEITVVKAAAK